MSTGRERFRKHKKIIECSKKILSFMPRPLARILLRPVCLVNGTIGVVGRYLKYALDMKEIGDTCYFANNLVVKNPNNISIGSEFSLHEFCYLDGAGSIKIGDNVSIAHNVSIISFDHTWGQEDVPIKYNPVVMKQVKIDSDVWIGCGVRILAGSHIERRVIVAAGAVVTGHLESGFIYGGVPAKPIKKL